MAQPCLAQNAKLPEWSFAGASDTLGWTSAGGTMAANKADGTLTIAGSNCMLISPMFEIKASQWQAIEIEMKSDRSGLTRLYYSNTTAEPYGGFRGELQTQIQVVGDGQFHKYTVFPCWQSQGKIIHVRIDPPGTNNAVKAIRIVNLEPESTTSATAWAFKDTAAGWRAFNLLSEPAASRTGWKLASVQDGLVLSPGLDFFAADVPWLTLRLASKSPHTLLFRWICAERDGFQSMPIEIKGGGQFHSYTFDLTRVSEWNGRILAVGVSPNEAYDPAEVTVESVSLGQAPVGPAEMKIMSFGLSDTFTRAGAKAKIVVEAMNAGGVEAKSINAAVTLIVNDAPKVLSVKTANSLAPGKIARFEWEETLPVGATVAASSVGAFGSDPDQKQARLRVYPSLDPTAAKSLKYVPEPKPVDTGDYLVGCYYFPGWRDYGAWSVLNDFPERRPILGYANDGSPEVVDWQIKWALDHGIKFMIYDWYWSKGGRYYEEGLNDGFLKAKHQDKMQFCLLWANHNGKGSHSEQDMLDVTKYWIDNYFKRPNYLKVDGKNVMVIFNPGGITEDMGKDDAKTAFVKMNKLCEDSGVGGLYLVACAGPSPDYLKTLADEGYAAISGYNYPWAGDKGQNVAPYKWMVDAYKDIWEQMAAMSSVPYIPLCESGWDSRPWNGPKARVRTGKSAELWQEMLANAKAYNDDPKHKLPGGKKLVFCEAWNEYGEGDYIEPTAGDGFDYLEAVRKVFAPTSAPPTIIVPKDLGMGPYDMPAPRIQSSWDFSKPEDRIWMPANMTSPTYESGILRTEVTGTDPMLSALGVQVDAGKYKTLEVKMRINSSDDAQFFFSRKQESMDEEKSVKFRPIADGQFHTYTVDLSANPRWKGTIASLRFDPTSTRGAKVEIAYIGFRE